jgi:VanZ family protein
MKHMMAGPAGWMAAAFILVAYFYVGLAPFKWDPPRWVDNGAVMTPQGTIRFASPGIAKTNAAPAWVDKAIATNQLKIDLRLQSASSDASRRARIVTLSDEHYRCNFTIAQKGTSMYIRLRTPNSSLNGTPDYRVRSVFQPMQWRAVQVVVDQSRLTVRVDGRQVLSRPLPASMFQNWNRDFLFAMGNELSMDRPWLGEIAYASVDVGGESFNCLAPGAIDFPDGFWKGLKFQYMTPERARVRDMLLNFLCFIPLGFVLAMSRANRPAVLRAVVVCAVASLLVESAQILFAYRMPSASDWAANTFGGLIGSLVAWCVAAGFHSPEHWDNRSGKESACVFPKVLEDEGDFLREEC